MKRFLPILLICLMLCLTACSGQIASAEVTNTLPEKETYTFSVSKMISGKLTQTGTAEYTSVKSVYEPTGDAAYLIQAVIDSEENRTTVDSYVSADRLLPLATTKTFTSPYEKEDDKVQSTGWKLVSAFDNDAKTCKVTATYNTTQAQNEKTEEKIFALSDPYLDNETLPLTIRGLSLTPGYNAMLNVAVSQYGKVENVKVSVSESTAQMTTAYGTYDCLTVSLSANTIFAGGNNAATFYITTDNVVLRIEQGPYIYDLISYTKG